MRTVNKIAGKIVGGALFSQVINKLKKFIQQNDIYLICQIETSDGVYLVSGKTSRMSFYLDGLQKTGQLIDYEIIDITSDRNASRQIADEI